MYFYVSEAFFAGVILQAEVAYFITNCTVLSDTLKQQLSQQFLTNLQTQGVCMNGHTPTCNIEDVTIDCGPMVDEDPYANWGSFRRKRSVGQLKEMRIKFKMATPQVPEPEANCSSFCSQSPVMTKSCLQLCEQQHRNSSTRTLTQATSTLQQLFGTVRLATPPTQSPGHSTQTLGNRRMASHGRGRPMPMPTETSSSEEEELPLVPVAVDDNGLTLRCSGLTLVPRQGLKTEAPRLTCAPGMASNATAGTCSE